MRPDTAVAALVAQCRKPALCKGFRRPNMKDSYYIDLLSSHSSEKISLVVFELCLHTVLNRSRMPVPEAGLRIRQAIKVKAPHHLQLALSEVNNHTAPYRDGKHYHDLPDRLLSRIRRERFLLLDQSGTRCSLSMSVNAPAEVI